MGCVRLWGAMSDSQSLGNLWGACGVYGNCGAYRGGWGTVGDYGGVWEPMDLRGII